MDKQKIKSYILKQPWLWVIILLVIIIIILMIFIFNNKLINKQSVIEKSNNQLENINISTNKKEDVSLESIDSDQPIEQEDVKEVIPQTVSLSACNSSNYSNWSACQSSGTQTRTRLSTSNCIGDLSLTQSCTYTISSPNSNPVPSVPIQTATPTPTTISWKEKAVIKAKSYLEGSAGYSRDKLITKLTDYDLFLYSDAVYGVDNSGANWNEQAAKEAKEYLDMQPFTRKSLTAQLLWEKFTQQQAEYGVNAVADFLPQ